MTGLGCSCGACKFLRRKCTSGCVFAPYFSYEQGSAHFAAVHKVYGASNVSRLLSHLPIHNRSDAAITITYEALARMHDPVYGCVAHIYALQQQVASLQEEIDIIGSLMANSTVGTAVNCGGFQASIMDSNNGIQNTTFQDDAAIRTQFYQNQLANLLSHHHQGNDMMMNQTLDSSKLDIEVPNNNNNNNALNGVLEEPLLFDDDDDSNSNNPLDKFLSGIDQEGFLNHPWFKHNAHIIN